MQSLGTGTQSASGLSAAFSTRPDSYLRKPGIGTDRQLGGGEKGIYKTSEIGPFDDPISRFEDNEEDDININIDIDFDDLNIDIGNINPITLPIYLFLSKKSKINNKHITTDPTVLKREMKIFFL